MKIPLLKLSIAPSFEDGFLLTLMENRGKDKTTYVLKYEATASEVIGQRFTISEEIKVTNEDAERILQMLKQASISVAPEYTLGLDGTSYELIVSGGLNEAHYKWWETMPKGWEKLAKISHAMLRLVVNRRSRHDAHRPNKRLQRTRRCVAFIRKRVGDR